jgi:hypothetical protein
MRVKAISGNSAWTEDLTLSILGLGSWEQKEPRLEKCTWMQKGMCPEVPRSQVITSLPDTFQLPSLGCGTGDPTTFTLFLWKLH